MKNLFATLGITTAFIAVLLESDRSLDSSLGVYLLACAFTLAMPSPNQDTRHGPPPKIPPQFFQNPSTDSHPRFPLAPPGLPG